MRLGTRSPNEFIQNLNIKNEKIQKLFLEKIQKLTLPRTIKVMLGDSTVVKQDTFDPESVRSYYEKFLKNLNGWIVQNTAISNNEDLRRIFTKFEIKEGNYLISGHISLQFQVLLFYKTDQRVIEAQKELAKIIDLLKNKEEELSNNSDHAVLEKLKEKGYRDFDHQKLFEIFYNHDKLRDQIYKEIDQKAENETEELSSKKIDLIKELDNLLIETYQSNPVLIDETKLVNGEEGFVCSFDIEFVKGRIKEGLFDPKKISNLVKTKIENRFDEILKFLESDSN